MSSIAQKSNHPKKWDCSEKAKNIKYKPSTLFKDASKYTHFSKNFKFWVNSSAKFILEYIFWVKKGNWNVLKDECPNTNQISS